jgi:hypothetical protein
VAAASGAAPAVVPVAVSAPAAPAKTPVVPPPVPPAVLAGAVAAATPLPKIGAATPVVRVAPVVTARAASARAGAPVSARAPAVPTGSGSSNWRRCANHRQARSDYVCPKCLSGFCDPCTQKVQSAAICPACEGLCVGAAAYSEKQEKTRQRARSMMDEVGVIGTYPLNDRIAYVMLALFTWFFGLFSSFPIMYVLSKGVLTWYSFNALSKVAIGNMRDVMPDFHDISDITNALRLSLAALVTSAGPLFLCVFLLPGAQIFTGGRSRDFAIEDTPVIGPGTVLLLALTLIWALAYMPVALTVAALSKSIGSTLNPVIGIDTIKKMGGTYWQALAIYGGILIGQAVLAFIFGFIPFAGGVFRGFIEAYTSLAVGCTLGLAVFKKAVELGWD